MRVPRNLQTDQDHITRFLTALGGAALEARTNKRAKAKFFIHAHTFINDYINEGFFKKEEVIINILVDGGFPANQGPVGGLRTDQQKCREIAETMFNAATAWEGGDESARSEVGWAAHEYSTTMRQHLDRLKTLIYPLVEQTLPIEAEEKVTEDIKRITFYGGLKDGPDKYVNLIGELEDEFKDWK
jgi:hemerythrin-like domain-containing protein